MITPVEATKRKMELSKVLADLLNFSPERSEDFGIFFKKLSDEEEGYGTMMYEPGDEKAPFFSETFLYNLLGKDDARTLRGLIANVCKAVGLEFREVERLAERLSEEKTVATGSETGMEVKTRDTIRWELKALMMEEITRSERIPAPLTLGSMKRNLLKNNTKNGLHDTTIRQLEQLAKDSPDGWNESLLGFLTSYDWGVFNNAHSSKDDGPGR